MATWLYRENDPTSPIFRVAEEVFDSSEIAEIQSLLTASPRLLNPRQTPQTEAARLFISAIRLSQLSYSSSRDWKNLGTELLIQLDLPPEAIVSISAFSNYSGALIEKITSFFERDWKIESLPQNWPLVVLKSLASVNAPFKGDVECPATPIDATALETLMAGEAAIRGMKEECLAGNATVPSSKLFEQMGTYSFRWISKPPLLNARSTEISSRLLVQYFKHIGEEQFPNYPN